jgi:hypothetical protein
MILGGVLGIIILISVIGGDFNEAKIRQMTPEEKCRHYEAFAPSRAQTFVKERLKAPSTATFPSSSQVSFSLDDSGNCIYEIRSNVDAQNSFGAQIRTDYYVRLMKESKADKWHLLDIRM